MPLYVIQTFSVHGRKANLSVSNYDKSYYLIYLFVMSVISFVQVLIGLKFPVPWRPVVLDTPLPSQMHNYALVL